MAKSIRAIEALEEIYKTIKGIRFCGFSDVDKEAVLTAINEQIEEEKKK